MVKVHELCQNQFELLRQAVVLSRHKEQTNSATNMYMYMPVHNSQLFLFLIFLLILLGFAQVAALYVEGEKDF